MNPRVAELVRSLRLEPHPEGGHYREIFRSPATVEHPGGDGPRAAVTQIYYLLAAGERSRWHAVRSDEIWQWHEGGELELFDLDPAAPEIRRMRLGPVGGEAEPCRVIPAGHWQAARPLGAFTLAGCTVAPGFEFRDFALIADLASGRRLLETRFPELVSLL